MFKGIFKKENKKYNIALVTMLVLIVIFTGLVTNKISNAKYDGKVKVASVLSESTVYNSNNQVEVNTANKTITGYDSINYTIKYNLETTDKKEISGREAIIEATLNENDTKYASWNLVNTENITSEIINDGKTLRMTVKNVTTNKDYEVEAKLSVTGAPSGYDFSPIVSVSEKTSEKRSTATEGVEVVTNSISGTVVDNVNNQKLENIQVEACELTNVGCINQKTTYTQKDGSYVLSNLKAGNYKISTLASTYTSQASTVELTEGNIENNIEVTPSPLFKADVKKYIKSVTIEENGQTKTYDYDNANKISLAVKNMANSTLRVIYEIKVSNNSEKSGYVKVIRESIPEGMEIDPDYSGNSAWTNVKGILYNKTLGNEPLKVGEEKIVTIGLKTKSTSLAGNYINNVELLAETYHNVNYIIEGKTVKSVVLLDTDLADEEEIPQKEGAQVKGWYTDREGNNKYDFKTPVKNDLNLYGLYKGDSHKVTFENPVKDYTVEEEVEYGEKATEPDKDNTTDEYDFRCWQIKTEENREGIVLEENYDASKCYDFDTPVEEDLELITIYTKKKFTVTFMIKDSLESAYHKYEVENGEQIVKYGEYIVFPEEPEAFSEYAFAGWYESNNNGQTLESTQVTGTTPVIKNMTLYAKYDQDVFDVTFKIGRIENGIFVSKLSDSHQKVNKGEKAVRPEDPETEEYEFKGKWYNDSLLTEEYDFNAEIYEDKIIYGEVKKKTKTVTLENPIKDYTEEEQIEYGEKATEPDKDNEETGYEFKCWQVKTELNKTGVVEDEEYDSTKCYDFDTPVTTDIDLISIYTKVKYRVILIDDGNEIRNVLREAGTTEVLPIVSKEHHTFSHWSETNEGPEYTELVKTEEAGQEVISLTVTKNITLYSVYDKEELTVTFMDKETINGEYSQYKDKVKVKYGDTVTLPEEPTMANYVFSGWYYSEDNGETLKERFDVLTPITENTVLYSDYANDVVKVNYRVGLIENGVFVDKIEKISNNYSKSTILQKPSNPVVNGYTFDDWYTDETLTTKYSFPKSLSTETEEITIYGKLNAKSNKVEFKYQPELCESGACPDTCTTTDCDVIPPIEDVPEGTPIEKPEDPKLDCMEFLYWSRNTTGKDSDGNEYKFDFENETISEDTILYAIFKVAEVSVTYVDKGEAVESEPASCGSKIITEKPQCDSTTTECDNDGREWECWRDAENPDVCIPDDAKITKDMTLLSSYVVLPTPTITHRPTEWTKDKVTVTISYPETAKKVRKISTKTVNQDETIVYGEKEEESEEDLTLTSENYDLEYQVVSEKDKDDDSSIFSAYTLGDWNKYTSSFEQEKNAIVVGRVIKKLTEETSENLEHQILNIDKKNPTINSAEIIKIQPTSFSVDIKAIDLQSGIRRISIFVSAAADEIDIENDTPKYSEEYPVRVNEEKNVVQRVGGLTPNRGYKFKTVVYDRVGNYSTFESEEFITREGLEDYVAQIIYLEGDDTISEENPKGFVTLAEAIEYCEINTCTIQMIQDTTESVSVLEGQDITLDLNARTVSGATGSYTIQNLGDFTIVDHSDESVVGSIVNTRGIAILSSGNSLQLGESEDPERVNDAKPLIIGNTIGIKVTEGKEFKFYDGTIKGTIAIEGVVTDTAFSYNSSVTSEEIEVDGENVRRQVANLKIVAEAEAKINTTYYSKLKTAMKVAEEDATYKLSDETESLYNYLQKTDTDSTYGNFIYDENEDAIVTDPNSTTSTTKVTYESELIIDLSKYSKNQALTYNVYTSSNETNKVTITDVKNDTVVDSISSITVSSNNDTTKRIPLEKGKIYKMTIYSYVANSKNSSFKVRNLTLRDNELDIMSFDLQNDLVNPDEYGFEYDSSINAMVSNNRGVDDSVAHAYLRIDLTGATSDRKLKVKLSVSSEEDLDYGYVTVNTSEEIPEYYDTTGQQVIISGTDESVSRPKEYELTLLAGQVNYVHFCFSKDSFDDEVGYDEFIIHNISDMEYEKQGIPSSQYYIYTPIMNTKIDTVELVRDVTLEETGVIVPDNQKVILDLNGHMLSAVSTLSDDYIIENNGDLKIIDSKYIEDIDAAMQVYREEQAQYDSEYAEEQAKYDDEYNKVLADVEQNKYTVNSYKKDNIKVILDGLEHGEEENVWKDLKETSDGQINGATWTDDNGLSFDGTDDYVLLDKLNYENITIETTFSVPEIKAGLYDIMNTSYSNGNQIYLNDGRICAYIYFSSGGHIFETSDRIVPNEKYHVALTYNGEYVKMFVNDKMVHNYYIGSTLKQFNTNLKLGSSSNSGKYFYGNIYSFRMYDKALDISDIQDNFNVENYRYNMGKEYIHKQAEKKQAKAPNIGHNGYMYSEDKGLILNNVGANLTLESSKYEAVGTQYNKSKGIINYGCISFDKNAYLVSSSLNYNNQTVILSNLDHGVILKSDGEIHIDGYGTGLYITSSKEQTIKNLTTTGSSTGISIQKDKEDINSIHFNNITVENSTYVENVTYGDISSSNISYISLKSNSNSSKFTINDSKINGSVYNEKVGLEMKDSIVSYYRSRNGSNNYGEYYIVSIKDANADFENSSIYGSKTIVNENAYSSRYWLNVGMQVYGSKVNFSGGTISSAVAVESYDTSTINISNSEIISSDAAIETGHISSYNSTVDQNVTVDNSSITCDFRYKRQTWSPPKPINYTYCIRNLNNSTISIDNTSIKSHSNSIGNADLSSVFIKGNSSVSNIMPSDKQSYAIYNLGNIEITDNFVVNNGFKVGIENESGSLTLKNNNDVISKNYPKIEGSANAISNGKSAEFIYKSGRLIGNNNTVILGFVSEFPENYDITYLRNGGVDEYYLESFDEKVANNNYVAKIENTNYVTLKQAVEASSNNDTIQFLKNIPTLYNVEIPENKKIEIDLSGFTYQSFSNNDIINNSGTLTINDSSAVSGDDDSSFGLGQIYMLSDKVINNNGTLKIDNSKINARYPMLYYYCIKNSGELTFENSFIERGGGDTYTYENKYMGILYNVENAKMTIKSGQIVTYADNEYNNPYNYIVYNEGNLIVDDISVSYASTSSSTSNRANFIYSTQTSQNYVHGGKFSQVLHLGYVYGNFQISNAEILDSVTLVNYGTTIVKDSTLVQRSGANGNVQSGVNFLNYGSMTIEDSSIKTLYNGSSSVYENAQCIINNSTVYSNYSGSSTYYAIYNYGNLTIKNESTIIGNAKQIVIYNYSTGKLNIGEKDGIVSKSAPFIENTVSSTSTYALVNKGELNFYDGLIKAYNTVDGVFNDVEIDYSVTNTDKIDGFMETYLDSLVNIEIFSSTGVSRGKFKSIARMNEADVLEDGDTIKIIDDMNISSTNNDYKITIPEDMNITIDLNGHTIVTNNDLLIENNGNLKIMDNLSNTKVGEIQGFNYHTITNNGKLELTSGKFNFRRDLTRTYNTTDQYDFITNSGKLIISGSANLVSTEYDYALNKNKSIINNINSGSIEILNGTLDNRTNTDCSYGNYAIVSSSTGNIDIKGGTIINVYMDSTGDLNITGGNLYCSKNISSTVTITGGTVDRLTSLFKLLINDAEELGSITAGGEYSIENSKVSYLYISGGTGTLENSTITDNINVSGKGTLDSKNNNIRVLRSYSNSENVINIDNDKIGTLSNELGTTNIKYAKITHINNNSTMVIEDVTMNSNETAIFNAGTLTIKKGSITSTNGDAINNVVYAKMQSDTTGIYNYYSGWIRDGIYYGYIQGDLILGEKNEENSETNLTISGKNYGINNEYISTNGNNVTGEISLYDGIIYGENNQVNGRFKDKENDFIITKEFKDNRYLLHLTNKKLVSLVHSDLSETEYNTFEEAIDNSLDGETIKLLEDFYNPESHEPIDVSSNKRIIIDLNGHIIENSRRENDGIFNNNGYIKITDSSTNKTGDLINIISWGSTYTDYIFKVVGGTLDIESVNITGEEPIHITNNGIVNMISGNFSTINSDGKNATMNINGGKVKTISGNGIVNIGMEAGTDIEIDKIGLGYSSKLIVNRGTITSIETSGESTIKNSTIGTLSTFNSDKEAYIENVNFVTESGSSILNGSTMYIKNCTFTGGAGILNYFYKNRTYYSGILNIQGDLTFDINSDAHPISYGVVSVKDSRIVAPNIIIYYPTTLYLNDNVYIESTENDAVQTNDANVYIYKNSTIKGKKSGINNKLGYYATKTVIQLGTKDDSVSIDIPQIIGEEYGIKDATIKFYDGRIVGDEGISYTGTINDIPAGYRVRKEVLNDGTEESILIKIGDEEIGVVMNGSNYHELQDAVDAVPTTGTLTKMVLYRNIIFDSNIEVSAGKNIVIVLNDHTLEKGEFDFTGDGTVTIVNSESDIEDSSDSSSGLLGMIRALLNIDEDTKITKNIVVYESDSGEKLESGYTYELQMLSNGKYETIDVVEDLDNLGRYTVATTTSDDKMIPINGRIYINNLPNGTYKIIGTDNKEVSFTITEDGTLSGNIKENHTNNLSNVMGRASAEMIVNIQTGQKVIRYGLIIILLGLITGGLIYIRKKRV